MRNFITIQSLLSRIPKSLFEESSESDFLDYFLDGIKMLPDSIELVKKLEILEVVDGKVKLPKDLKIINNIYWQETDPSEEDILSLDPCLTYEEEGQDINPDICKPMITYKMWFDSPYFKSNFRILKYVGEDKSMISSGCKPASCSETYIVTPEKMLYLSIDCGFLCLEYEALLCNSKGEYLIEDIMEVQEYLIAYAIYRHWENRQFTKEEQAASFTEKYKQEQALRLRQARGKILMRKISIADIYDINGQYLKLIKIPEIFRYARQKRYISPL